MSDAITKLKQGQNLSCEESKSLFSNLMDTHSEILSCPPDSLQWIVENIHSKSFLEIRGKGLIHKSLINWIISNCPFLFKPQKNKIFETPRHS